MLFDLWDLNRIRGMVQIKINGRISEWVMSNPKLNDMVILKWLHFIFEDCYFFAIRREKFIQTQTKKWFGFLIKEISTNLRSFH